MDSIALKILFFSFVLYKTADAAVARFLPEEKPAEFADRKGCYLSSLKRLLEIGVPYSPQDGLSCVQYNCQENGETSLFTCGSIFADDGCVLAPGNRTLPYPDCCDSIECNEKVDTDSDCE